MGFLKNLFGKKASQQPPSSTQNPPVEPVTSNPAKVTTPPKTNHEALLKEVIQLAKEIPEPDVISDELTSISIPSSIGDALVHKIDEYLAQDPKNIDMYLVKHSVLRLMLRGQDAQEALDKAASINPHHIDVDLAKNMMSTWGMFPKWGDNMTTLPNNIRSYIQSKPMLVVRDGLSLGLAVFNVVNPSEFPMGFSPSIPSKWEPVFSKTPMGAIVAHYSVFADNPSDPYRNEKFLNISTGDTLTTMSGRKIVERLSFVRGCYIIFTDGYRILYNKFYVPDNRTRQAWDNVVRQTLAYHEYVGANEFKQGYNWHMNHFQLSNIKI